MENNNGFFSKLENTRPFVKIGLEGFAGSGKTYTAAEIAIGLHKKIKSKKPIAFYDTEKAVKALEEKFDKAGIEVLTKESRTLRDLNTAIKTCEQGVADILVIDSLTHVWESFLTAYKNQKKRDNLYFQDWGIIKPRWKKDFSDLFVQSNLHIIFTGRAGYEYDETLNERGLKEITRSGIKMKVENETAYEPDMLILMERREDIVGKDKKTWREATILKDRTSKIDGKTFKNPSLTDFMPFIDIMIDGVVKKRDEVISVDKFDSNEENSFAEKRAREIAYEEIKGVFDSLALGTSKDEKKLKTDVVEYVFGTSSNTAIQSMKSEQLKEGALIIKDFKIKYLQYLEEKKITNEPLDYSAIMDLLEKSREEVNLF